MAEMTDEAVAEAIRTVKAAFLRFFVSLMAKYQVRVRVRLGLGLGLGLGLRLG